MPSSRTEARTGQGRSERAPGDDRPYSGQREGADPRQQTDDASQDATAKGARRRRFRRQWHALRCGERSAAVAGIAQHDTDRILREPGELEVVNRLLGVRLALEQCGYYLWLVTIGAGAPTAIPHASPLGIHGANLEAGVPRWT